MDAPIYIVSKGRSGLGQRRTMEVLHGMGISHYVIVEAQEVEDYRATANPSMTLLVLDPEYQRSYETCLPPGSDKSTGSGPARNFAWDHAKAGGASWHWTVDDNISQFHRLNRNMKVPLADRSGFRVMEAFADRYENVAMAGPNYEFFVIRKEQNPPFNLNTRVYSCNLIRTGLDYRWRGRYNEDTDLSLRMLKDGWCTVLFNAYLQKKRPTMERAGGNTSEFYAEEGTLPKSQMLVDLHPDVARVTWKYGRWHHEADYSVFKQRLKLRPGASLPDGIDNFGMVLERLVPGLGWVEVEQPWYPWEDAG
jgi:hypothetical protein